MKVIILGAGVGGLCVAHQLSKYQDIEILVIERNEIAGGQARSQNENQDHSEYCWHIIGQGYVNLIPILDEIPSYDNRSVKDHLKPITNFIYGRSEKGKEYIFHIEKENSFITTKSLCTLKRGLEKCGGKLTCKDIFLLINMFLVSQLYSQERLEKYATIPWREYMNGLSPELKKWVIDMTSIYLGMDYSKLSSYMMLDLFRHNANSGIGPNAYYAFDGSMNDIWFNPWI